MKKFLKRMGIVILILLGLVLVFNQQLMELTVSKLSENQVENVTKENIANGKESKADFNFDSVKSISPQVVGRGMLGGFPILGKLSVPSVGVELPIGKGVGEGVLNQGAGTMKPDQKMGSGNYALAGHHVRGRYILFSPLVDVKKGAYIYITDMSKVYKYKIYSKRVIQPTEVKVIDDVKGKNIITLITCADAGTKRWAIQGELVTNEVATKQKLNDIKKDTNKVVNKQKSQFNYLFFVGIGLLLIIILFIIRSLISKSKKK